MGLSLHCALFPGVRADAARKAVETAAENPAFFLRPEECRYAESEAGTQVLVEGDAESEPLARALFRAARAPVMLLYLYDGDYWGYDFYAGEEQDHFRSCPGYFAAGEEERRRLAGSAATLARWFPVGDSCALQPYLLCWPEQDGDWPEKAGTACPGDRYGYGDCRQATDFAARLGFPWAFDAPQRAAEPPLPVLRDILAQNLPPVAEEPPPEERSALWALPSAFSHEYIRRLLREEGVRELAPEEKTPREVLDAVNAHRRSAAQPERDPLCQRLAVLGAFCAFWLGEGNPWGFLDGATYEPVYLRYEKPSDLYVLRARAAVTDFVKRHRAMRDLRRLIELDPERQDVYLAEMKRWEAREEQWRQQNEAARRQRKQ